MLMTFHDTAASFLKSWLFASELSPTRRVQRDGSGYWSFRKRKSVINHMTPVGSQRCPNCDGIIVPEVQLPFGAAECASCGCPVWFLTINGSLAFFRHCDSTLVLRLFEAVPERLPAHLKLDSLDLVELVTEFES